MEQPLGISVRAQSAAMDVEQRRTTRDALSEAASVAAGNSVVAGQRP